MADDRDSAYLLDMLQAARKVERYVRGKTFPEFESDEILQDAIERNVEIIGEAARKVSEAFKQAHPEIPWRKIIAQRNVLVHEYESIGLSELWEVATRHVPDLAEKLAPLLPPTPSGDPG